MENGIEREIILIVSDITGFEPEDIKLETNFTNDLEVGSIKAIEITVALAKKVQDFHKR